MSNSFFVKSGKLSIFDPCKSHSKDGNFDLLVKNGKWEVKIDYKDLGNWGKRPAVLNVWHNSFKLDLGEVKWKKLKNTINVDSGLAGIFCNSICDEFLWEDCNNTNELFRILDRGVSCLAGLGDYRYEAFILQEKNVIMATKIVFLDEGAKSLSKAPEYCPVLGKTIKLNNSKLNNYAIFDRIDSTKRYEENNSLIISVKANKIKGDATSEDLQKVAFELENRIKTDYSI